MKVTLHALLVFSASWLAAAPARAAGDEADDPKLARRLGARISVQAPMPTASRARAAAAPASVQPIPAAPTTPRPPMLAVDPGPLPAPANPSTGSGASASTATWPEASGPPVVSATGEPPPERETYALPRVKLAFRRFDFVRIGASGSADGSVASEAFNSLSLDVYPVSSILRVGLSTQYGWESGSWLANGDYFAAESLSIGAQLPLGERVMPFAETFGGIGYMRRLQFDRTVPTAYWQLGIDAGAEIYFARLGFVSAAVGYLHPVNGFAKLQEFQTVFVDTWSFKLGIGL
jgi:hypothetical protein